MSEQEFDAEKYFMHSGFVSKRDIEKYGMCIESPQKMCHDSCQKFMTRQCNGSVLIRQAGGTIWVSRGWYKKHDR